MSYNAITRTLLPPVVGGSAGALSAIVTTHTEHNAASIPIPNPEDAAGYLLRLSIIASLFCGIGIGLYQVVENKNETLPHKLFKAIGYGAATGIALATISALSIALVQQYPFFTTLGGVSLVWWYCTKPPAATT